MVENCVTCSLVDEERAFREIRLPTTQEQLAGQAEAFAGRRGGLLRAVSATDGSVLTEDPSHVLDTGFVLQEGTGRTPCGY